MKSRLKVVTGAAVLAIAFSSAALAVAGPSSSNPGAGPSETTTSMMLAAAQKYVSCVESLGVEGRVTFDAHQQAIGYRFSSNTGDVSLAVESEAGAACYAENIKGLDYSWADQHVARPEGSEWAQFYAAVYECAADTSPGDDEDLLHHDVNRIFLEEPTEFAKCWDIEYVRYAGKRVTDAN